MIIKDNGKNTPIGKMAAELAKKDVSGLLVGDVSSSHVKELFKLLMDQVEATKKNWKDEDFFIEIAIRKDPITDIIRKLPQARRTCPEPFYDQQLFYYDHHKCELELLWVVPDIETCALFISNPLSYSKTDKALLDYVLDFNSGALDRKMYEFSKKREKACQKILRVKE